MADIWVDYLDREFLNNDFIDLVKSGLVTGLTSNPSIFANALKKDIYKDQISKLKSENKSPKDIYEDIAVEDIKKACDILNEYSKNNYSFASIEVDPRLINDTKGTIDEALRLVDKIERDNLMIKIPANEAGYKAIEELAKKGININATLVFSPNQAMQVFEIMDKYNIKGVISVFVSRFDRKLNDILVKNKLAPNRVGFFNALKIYNQIKEAGNPNIKTLFASTGVKQKDLEKDYYVQNLNMPDSILTLPLDVIEYIKDRELEESFAFQTKHIDAFFSFLTPAGINMHKIYQELFDDGVKAFEDSFSNMLDSIER